ncbi:MAG: pilus assembly FimT family protein [Myxococcota bacterium]
MRGVSLTNSPPSPPPSPKGRGGRRGVTLIELMIALTLITVFFSVAVLSVGALTGTKAKAAAGELGGVIRSLYDTAALSGKTCRLVFELPGPKEDEDVARYWAECAAGNVTARKDREDELEDASRAKEEEARKKDRGASDDRFRSYSDGPSLQELLAAEKDRVENAAKYSQYTSPEIEPRELPGAVKLSVWTRHQREAVSAGTAYLYFFPQGFTEKAHVYVRQGDNVWTITVSPLTGKTKVVAEELEVPRS